MTMTKENLESDVRAFQALLECNDEALTGKSDAYFEYEIEVRTLALRGLATMLRPIEEAPKTGWTIVEDENGKVVPAIYECAYEGDSETEPYSAFWQTPNGASVYPKYFYDLSALESPKP